MKNDNYNNRPDSATLNQYNSDSATLNQDNYELTEKDFYPPKDTRVFKSGVRDIVDGDNFDDYLDCFLEMCYEEEVFEN